WNSESGQMVSWAPRPITSSSAGSLLLPAVSYSISMPFALTLATPSSRSVSRREPTDCADRCRQRGLLRAIGAARVVCNRRPQAGILDVAAEHLEAEAAVGPPEQVDAAVVLGILDALQHDPRLVDAHGHRSVDPAARRPPQHQRLLPWRPAPVE